MSFASTSTVESEPPFYILLQNATSVTQTTAGSASTFVHPAIEYHFADDSPSALLPASDAEVVVIVDYNGPDLPPTVHSLHPDLAVTGIKITDAPGAAAALPRRNDKMYVLETVSSGDNVANESGYDMDNPQVMLAQFKDRNVALKRILNEPSPSDRPSGYTIQNGI